MNEEHYQHQQKPIFLILNFSLTIRNVVSWRCSVELKKGWNMKLSPWFIIYTVTVTKVSLLPVFSSFDFLPRSFSHAVRKKNFCENLISFFDFFFCQERNEDLVKNVLIYGSRKSRCFLHESCSWSCETKVKFIIFLTMMHVFQFAFLKRKKGRRRKVEKCWSNHWNPSLLPKPSELSFYLLSLADKQKVNKSLCDGSMVHKYDARAWHSSKPFHRLNWWIFIHEKWECKRKRNKEWNWSHVWSIIAG